MDAKWENGGGIAMKTIGRFLLLVVLLNVVRYVIAGLVEGPLIMPSLMGVMEAHPNLFTSEFTTLDWITSFTYNFVMWMVVVWVYHLAHSSLAGSDVIKSLKIFGIGWLFFASVSLIYMNHYGAGREFYLWNILDGIITYSVVGIANGLLYRRLMGTADGKEKPETADF